MEKRHKIELREMTQEELDSIKYCQVNRVLVKIAINTDKTQSGVYLPDHEWEFGAAAHSQRVGVVVKLPPYLKSGYAENIEPTESGYQQMVWDTDMELKVGDKIWFDHLEALNSEGIKVPIFKGDLIVGYEEYRLVGYPGIIVAIRDGEVIPVNGNILFEEVKIKKKALDYEKEVVDKRKGRALHIGKPIKKYWIKSDKRDHEVGFDVKKGDLVTFTKKYATQMFLYLEEPMHSVFPDKNMIVAQRRRIAYVHK